MNTKQVVAVIGASGEMGCAIAKSIANGNYRMLLQSLDADKIQIVADDIKGSNPSADLDTVNSAWDACWEADIVVMAVPYEAEKEVARYQKGYQSKDCDFNFQPYKQCLYRVDNDAEYKCC